MLLESSHGVCVPNTPLIGQFGQLKEVSFWLKIQGNPKRIGPGCPASGVCGFHRSSRSGCLEELSVSRALLSTWSCWQIYCCLCDRMDVMEMAGAVLVASYKKKKNPSRVSAVVKTQLFSAFWTGCTFATRFSSAPCCLVGIVAELANTVL